MNLFPIISPKSVATKNTLPLCTEAAWDFEHDHPKWRSGSPVIVTGAEAVLVWAWKALRTPRFRYEIYTHNYGCEAEELIGQTYSEDLKRAEAVRYVRECLDINPYIDEVNNIKVIFTDGAMQISCHILTIYGEVTLDV